MKCIILVLFIHKKTIRKYDSNCICLHFPIVSSLQTSVIQILPTVTAQKKKKQSVTANSYESLLYLEIHASNLSFSFFLPFTTGENEGQANCRAFPCRRKALQDGLKWSGGEEGT